MQTPFIRHHKCVNFNPCLNTALLEWVRVRLCKWACTGVSICSVLKASVELWCKHAGSSVLPPQLSAGAGALDEWGPLQSALPYQERQFLGKLLGHSRASVLALMCLWRRSCCTVWPSLCSYGGKNRDNTWVSGHFRKVLQLMVFSSVIHSYSVVLSQNIKVHVLDCFILLLYYICLTAVVIIAFQ